MQKRTIPINYTNKKKYEPHISLYNTLQIKNNTMQSFIIKLQYPRHMEETIYVQCYWMANPQSQTIIYNYDEKWAYKFNKNDRSIVRKAMNHIIFTWYKDYKMIAKPQVTPIGT